MAKSKNDPGDRRHDNQRWVHGAPVVGIGSRAWVQHCWIKEAATKLGYEVSFMPRFCAPHPLRTLEEVNVDLVATEREAERLLFGLPKMEAAA